LTVNLGLKQGLSVMQIAIMMTLVIIILSSLQECITVQSPLYLLALHLKQAYSVAR
jgi:hypothetical protein